MNMKKITSMTLMISGIILIFNSVVLYVVPEGRISNWADWRFLGLTKGDWAAQHITVGILFGVAGILHLYYNWKAIVAYMKNKAREMKVFTGAFNVALILSVVFVVGTYYDVPPLSTIIDFSESFKDAAAKKYGDPPYGHAESSSIKMFTKRENLDLAKSIELLGAAGINVTDEKETIREIADKSNKSPQQIYELIKPASLTPVAPEGESDDPSAFLQAPKSGLGKKTINDICSEYNLDVTMIVKGLEEQGIKAEPDEKLKDIATAHDTGPMQIYEAMVEIVSKSSGK